MPGPRLGNSRRCSEQHGPASATPSRASAGVPFHVLRVTGPQVCASLGGGPHRGARAPPPLGRSTFALAVSGGATPPLAGAAGRRTGHAVPGRRSTSCRGSSRHWTIVVATGSMKPRRHLTPIAPNGTAECISDRVPMRPGAVTHHGASAPPCAVRRPAGQTCHDRPRSRVSTLKD